MRSVVLAAAALAAVATLVTAGSTTAEAKPKWKGGHHGYHRGGPPPWAPAHGYRRKHERGYSYRRGYDGPRWRY